VSVTVTANVAQSEEEAVMQAKGIDPARRAEEEEAADRAAERAADAAAEGNAA
jgi:hypothetical protein